MTAYEPYLPDREEIEFQKRLLRQEHLDAKRHARKKIRPTEEVHLREYWLDDIEDGEE